MTTDRALRADRRANTPPAAKRTRRPQVQIPLSTPTGTSAAAHGVVVSSGVTISAAPSDHDSDAGDDNNAADEERDRRNNDAAGDEEEKDERAHDGNSDEDNNQNGDDDRGPRRNTSAPRSPSRRQQSNQDAEDDLESMDRWEALTPGQQRAMMRRFMMQPPAPAAAPAPPVVVRAPAPEPQRRHKMKYLNLEDFMGKSSESVEAWLATIPQEVERQAGLGGDTWTPEELYYGATAHLKDAASKWLITMTENMRAQDKNLTYLIRMMRKKYGRRENMFKIQQRLAACVQQPGERLGDFAASLTNIGFGKRVPAESYVEAFINGINNETTTTQVRTYEPQTLDEAVQFAEDKCGEFGEGFKVTDWRVAKRRYREDREYGAEDDAQPAKKKAATAAETAGQIDWKRLGLGFGGSKDSPLNFDTEGKAVSGMAETARKDPVSVAALQALMLVAGLGREDGMSGKMPPSKSKVARTLEVKTEAAADNQQPAPSHQPQQSGSNDGAAWQPRGGVGRGGRGYGRGRGGGRGGQGLASYGPPDQRTLEQRKSEASCAYCHVKGHWWLECEKRLAEQPAQPPAAQQNSNAAAGNAASTPTAGNGPRQ